LNKEQKQDVFKWMKIFSTLAFDRLSLAQDAARFLYGENWEDYPLKPFLDMAKEILNKEFKND